uniref:Autophagy protein 5 n=1 Tax=Clastoptera arizonana TaxID=38151 RepID=A0A1B6CPK7_9HEMI
MSLLLCIDKFDQFWAVNRKLMEVGNGGEDTFKYIPFRCYLVDKDYTMIQRLVKPLTDDGHRKTLGCFIEEVFPSKEVRIITHGVEPMLETPIQWMSEHLSYPDNFLHLCVIIK